MEKQRLKKSGIIAVIITFAAIGFWFGFSKLSLGAYDEKTLTRQFLAEDSEVFKTLVIEVGSDTVARIIAGTTSMTRTGTATYPGQPRIEYSGVTGKWSFKNVGGTETVAFGTVSASYVAAEIGSATANYVLKTNGSSTGQLATDATLAGSTTIGTTSTMTADGITFSGTKVKYLSDVTQNIQTQIDGKQASIGQTPLGSNIGSVTAALGSQSIDALNDVNTGTMSEGQVLKKIGGVLVGASSSAITYWADILGHPESGTTANAYISTSPGAGKIPFSDSTGMFNLGEFKGTATVPSQIVFGSTSVKMRVQNSTGEYSVGSTTVLMLRFEGGSGTTNFLDSSSSPVAGTASGNTQISSLFPSFGTGSGYFGGTSDSIGFADHPKFTIGTQSFKIDVNVRMGLATDTINYGIIGQGSDSDNHWGLYYAGPGDGIVLYSKVSGVTTSVTQGTTTGWLPNTKYHIRAERHGSSVFLSRGGIRIVTGTITNTIGDYTGTVTVGSCLLLNPAHSFKGHMDELSLDIGTAVGTPSFSIPDELNYLFVTGSQSVSKVAVIIGTESATKGKNFEIAPGLETLSDNWGLRCFPEQKTVVGFLDYKQSYDQARDIVVKKQVWNRGQGLGFIAPSIADTTTPREIMLISSDGKEEGLSTISYLGWLTDVCKGIIMEHENVKFEYQNRIRLLEAQVEMLKNK